MDNNLEKRIIAERTTEAMKKNLMGLNGKFGAILKELGDPIIAHGEGGLNYSSTSFDDGYDYNHESLENITNPEDFLKKLPMVRTSPQEFDTDDYEGCEIIEAEPRIIGYLFDGLSRGMHLEIKYIELHNTIEVFYKGHRIYLEISGELKAYSPLDEWESKINDLYEVAKKKRKVSRANEKLEEIKAVQKNKMSWWAVMKTRWGL